MNTLNKLLDTARKMCDRDSDAALAEKLGVSRTTLMQWRRGERRITDEHLAALVAVGQADPALAVKVRQEGAETKAERALWGPLWDRLSPVTSTVAGVLLLVGLVGHSAPVMALTKTAEAPAMHIMSIARTLIRRLRSLWDSATPAWSPA
jgi:transcriptional regulator with XRE-family HTH domain